MKYLNSLLFIGYFIAIMVLSSCEKAKPLITIQKDDHIILIGNNLCSRMMNYGYFETELITRFPQDDLYIRNMCDGGDTPGFRPHSGRNDPWAFPGAEKFQDEFAQNSGSEGHLDTPDEWLNKHKADKILAFYGYSESQEGAERLDNFKNELTAFVTHTLSQTYNGAEAPELVLFTPIAFEDLSDRYDLPDGKSINENLKLYSEAIIAVADSFGIASVDLYTPSSQWMKGSDELTIDGLQLNDVGYQKLSKYIADVVVGGSANQSNKQEVLAAVKEKNWFWHNDFKIPNGVHVFGRRYDPFGPANYPSEFIKLREMTANRDTAIWYAAKSKTYDLEAADGRTSPLAAVESNFKPGDYGRGSGEYLYGDEATKTITVADGYKIELFASEEDFPDLANPVQLSFDNKGRLWVAVMPTYPHWKPGDPKPNDKLIILEDTDNDGKADKQITWVDGLHIPVGFEFAPEGVYISQGTNLKLYTDTDGDDKADKVEIIYSGFDDHDTHHVISAFCADPSGALYMGEGVFLQTNVETPYGTVRGTNGGFYRYAPQNHHLERTAQLSIPNPWGIAFDDWGQPIFAETSGPDVRWMLPGTVKSRYGRATDKSFNLIEEAHKVRPTSGLEFVSSRHFPDEVQGDLLINNSIGFLGMKQHQMLDDSTGFATKWRQDLMVGTDPNFRPVDMEFAPDGSLYVVDWHNVLIGHMQHNARDPYRDHVHGRIYRITYPARPLVQSAKIVDASIDELFENLKLPEYRTRYRTRRELRGRDKNEVFTKVVKWANELDKSDPNYDHNLVEALWVTWGIDKIDNELLKTVLSASDYRARAAGLRVIRYMNRQIPDYASLLKKGAADEHGRVRLEAILAASYLDPETGNAILDEAAKHEVDRWLVAPLGTARAHLNKMNYQESEKTELVSNHLEGPDFALFKMGKEIFERDGFCGTCHQYNGKGLAASGFPPLTGTQWVVGSEERLIKIVMRGLYGPITVLNKEYPGQVPMTPYGDMLNDEEIAAVTTYVRNAFYNRASVVSAATVKKVREQIKDKKGFYKPEELLKEHPLEK